MMGLVRCFGLLGLAVLTGCGTDRDAFQSELLSRVSTIGKSAPELPPIRARLTPTLLAAIPGAILIVEVPNRGAEAGAQIIREGRGHVIWSTLNEIQFTFRDGVLSSTRGLGGDLISSDLDEVVPAVRGARSQATRVHRYLDGEDQIVARAFICTYERTGGQRVSTVTRSFNTTLVTETCNSTDQTIENQYWIDGAGIVRKSKQWVGPYPEYVNTEWVKD
ncbi:MAG: YjbF family lipoprotein [Aliishimia sp.]